MIMLPPPQSKLVPTPASVLRGKDGPNGIGTSRDEAWTSARKTLSPAFSASKMKAVCACTPVIVCMVFYTQALNFGCLLPSY